MLVGGSALVIGCHPSTVMKPSVHLSVAMTSAVTLFIARYALHTDPLVIVGLILMIHGLVAWFRQRCRQVPVGADLRYVGQGAGAGDDPAHHGALRPA